MRAAVLHSTRRVPKQEENKSIPRKKETVKKSDFKRLGSWIFLKAFANLKKREINESPKVFRDA